MRRLLMLVAVVGLAACGRNDNPTFEVPTTAAGASTTVAASATTLFDGGTTQVSTAPSTPPGYLSNIEVGAHEGFERIVFTFNNLLPGYRIGPVNPPFREDGSGKPVAVQGSHFLEAHFSAAGYDTTSAYGTQTYTGPTRIGGPQQGKSTAVIVEMARTGDFEGYLTWVIGTANATSFKVFTQTNPNRVVIDIANA